MSTLTLYFDFSCPWSFISLVRLQDVGDRNATPIELKPVNVDAVLATENPVLQATRLAENPAKAAWQKQDLEHWARLWGLKLELPVNWPFDSQPAAKAAFAAIQSGKGLDFSLRLFQAIYGQGVDPNDSATFTKIAAETGLDATDFQKLAAVATTDQQIASWTEELVRRGGFGTPSVYVDDQLFFGNDRIPLVDWILSPISDDSFVMPGQHDG